MPNGNDRGNTTRRRQRKLFLLNKFGRCINGLWVAQCWECSTIVTYVTMMVDRIIPGIDGGRYTKDNIRIHCPTCSHSQGQTIMRRRKANELR